LVEITLDASQLEAFEPCPHKWYLDHKLSLTSVVTNPNLSTGTWYHEVLKFYYQTALDKKAAPSENLKGTVAFAQTLIVTTEVTPELAALGVRSVDWPAVRKDPKFHLDRLKAYLIANIDWDDSLEIVAVEKGFSTILYEDAISRYILEGMIDLVAIAPKMGLVVIDHKTQSRHYGKYGYNHQALNYLSFTGASYFLYNYIGLQDSVSATTFRKELFRPYPGMLKQWREDVKNSFMEMEHYLGSSSFPRRRSACQTKFGVCQFHKLCEFPQNSPQQVVVLSHYKEKEKKWKAWA
jgi:hypothetical protein